MIYVAHDMEPSLRETLQKGVGDEPVIFAPWPKREAPVSEWPAEFLRATVLVGSGARLTQGLLSHLSQLRWVHAISAGVDTLPLGAMEQRGVLLSNSRGIHGTPIAEQILGMMLSFARGLHGYWDNQQHRQWERQYPMDELAFKTLLILGAGSIGQEVARKAKAFDMEVVGIKAHLEMLPHFDRVGTLKDMDSLLPEADYIVVLFPLTEATYHLINAERLHRMKRHAVLINFGRGPVIDQEALTQALKDQVIGGAGLDVFETEPLPASDPLWSMTNVLITPHTGGGTPSYDARLVDIFLANWRAFQEGQPLATGVDFRAGY